MFRFFCYPDSARTVPDSLSSILLLPVAVAFLGSYAVTRVLARIRSERGTSLPNERSLHRGAIPRTGGFALWTGVGLGLVAGGVWLSWFGCLALLLVVFAIEDLLGVHAGLRFAAQLAAATCLVFVAASPGAAGWGGMLLMMLAAVWAANLYNFMDGSDGLAAVTAVLGFATLAASLAARGDGALALAAASIAAAAAGFVPHNLHPARIFMGDLGAVPLGFAAAAIGLEGIVREHWPAWFPVLVFTPFVVDASVTLLRRTIQGFPPWKPHKDHCYQRLVQLGAGHPGTAWAYTILMVACCAVAAFTLARVPEHGWSALSAAVSVCGVLYWRVARRWATRARTSE